MKVIQLMTGKEIQACVKFEYRGYEISLSTDNGRPWLAVFKGEMKNPVFTYESHDLLTGIEEAKDFINAVTK